MSDSNQVGAKKGKPTWGFMSTRSIKSTTKSCSTYLSQNWPQLRHTVRRMLCPLALSPAPEYCVQSVLTGYRHSMQMGILAAAGQQQKEQQSYSNDDGCCVY